MPTHIDIPATDAELAEALESAHVPTLLTVLVQLTGDTSLLRGKIRPGPAVLGDDGTSGLTAAERAEARATALRILKSLRDERPPLPPPPSEDMLVEMMSFCLGEAIPSEYVPMMREEMALEGRDGKRIAWTRKPADAVVHAFHVLIVGAGMSGLCAAIMLEELGIPYTVVDKNGGVGGTWFENSYPGCRVDVPNHFYSYSFEPNHDWSHFFSKRDDLRAYFEACSVRYGVRSKVRFDTEVATARYDESTGRWHAQLRSEGRADQVIEANAIISAVGQLNRPKIPRLEGLESFDGPAFHTARWQHEHDLTGKRVAIVGTGASAMQVVPAIAERVRQLIIFQRSPQWAAYIPDYFRAVSPGKKWLLKHIPYYAKWFRFALFWRMADGIFPALQIDPEWNHPDVSLNAINDAMREVFTQYIHEQIGDDPELLDKVIPRYPPFGKRMLLDNGWFRTLKRDNVDLVTDGIRTVTRNALVTEAGKTYPVDAIVFATGFHSNRFLWPMKIVGRSGVTLSEVWGEDPRAYLGMTMPGFPNLFCLYGPNTNLAHGGSIIFHTECQVRYITACLTQLLENGLSSIECRHDVHDAYNERVDAAHAKMVWTHRGMTNWYKNSAGRVTTNSPWRLVDYWNMTRTPNLSDFVLS